MNAGVYLVKEYLWDIYRVNSRAVFNLIQKNFGVHEKTVLCWHVTLVSPHKILVITDAPHKIREVQVMGVDGQKKIFKAVSLKG